MINLRCTKKLLSRLRVAELEEENISTNLLGAWYANHFNISRKQFAIFTNERTVLSVVIPMKEISTLTSRFLLATQELLNTIGIPDHAVNAELKEMKVIKFGRTNNRKLLGNMNDLTNGAEAWFSMPHYEDLSKLNMHLAEYLVGPEPYRVPKEVVLNIFKRLLIH
jgi:hypothetical protein